MTILFIAHLSITAFSQAPHEQAGRAQQLGFYGKVTSINGEVLPSDPAGSEAFGFVPPNEHDNYVHEVCLGSPYGVLISVGTFRGLNLASAGMIDRLILFDHDKGVTAFNLINVQLIRLARDRYEYLSLLLTGEIDETLMKEAKEKKLNFNAFGKKLSNASDKSVAHKWEKLIFLPKDYQETFKKMKAHNFIETMATLESALSSFESAERTGHAILTSDERFGRIRQMVSEGKVNVMLGDLTGNSMEKLGGILRRANEEVSAVDVSNVPGYFTINPGATKKMSTLSTNLQKLPLAKNMNLLFTEEIKYSASGEKFKDLGRWFHYCLGKSDLRTIEQFKDSEKPLKAYQAYLDTSFRTPKNSAGRPTVTHTRYFVSFTS